LVANGPADPENIPHEIRGMSVYKAGSLEHAREIASGDPAVQSGRLMVEVYPFWFADDTISRGRQSDTTA
jgi:hypothetical protein